MSALVRPVPMTAERAVRFKAWYAPEDTGPGPYGVESRYEANPLGIPVGAETPDEVAAAHANCLTHKGSLIVLRIDDAKAPDRRNLVSIYSVKKRTAPIGWDRPEPHRRVAIYKFYADLVTCFCFHGDFEPVQPQRIEDGPVGRLDLTLVTQ